MDVVQKTYAQVDQTKEPFIDVHQPPAGWQARQMVWWNDEDGGQWDDWRTGCVVFHKKEEAVAYNKNWAETQGIAFVE